MSNRSSSSAARYLARIFVAVSTSANSRPRPTRASRKLLPISSTAPDFLGSQYPCDPAAPEPVGRKLVRAGVHDRAHGPEPLDLQAGPRLRTPQASDLGRRESQP